MAQQGCLFRLFNNAVNYRSILNQCSRITVTGHQQCAGIKQESKDTIQALNLPEKPKKPLSPYFRYMVEQRPDIKKKFPSLKLVEIAKKVSEGWASASDSLKAQYNVKYQAEMVSYKELNEAYKQKLTPDQKEALQTLKKQKENDKRRRQTRKLNREENKPKRPVGPFMQYLLATSKREGLKMNEMLSSMKGKWGMLSDSEKDKYNKLYDEDKIRYQNEMKVWEAKMINEGKLGLVRRSTQLAHTTPSRLKSNKKE